MCDSTTNQQFPILKDSTLEALKDSYSFSFWEKHDDTTSVVRVCTSFATTDEMIEKLALDIINCEKK